MKRTIITVIVIVLLAVCNGQETLSSTTGKVEFNGNGFSTNTVSIGEFNPDRTCSSDASSAFISAFRSDKDVVFIPKGCYLIANQIIIPKGKTLVFEKGALLDITVSLSGNFTKIHADQNQIFTLKSDLQGTWIANNGEAYPEWFGAKGDGTGTIDAAAIQKALEVFCTPVAIGTYGNDYKDRLTRWFAAGNIVKVSGYLYNIEKTIEFPKFGNLKVGVFTSLYGGDGFYEPFVLIRSTPYWIDGGRYIVRRYDAQTSYENSAKDDKSKIRYAYNKNPVFRLYLSERLHSTDLWGATNSMYKSTIQNVEIRQIARYPRADAITPDLLYSAFFITADTSIYTSGAFKYQKNYQMVEYKTGDDFSNVTSDGSAPVGTFITNFPAAAGIGGEYPETVTPNDWTHGSIVQEHNGAYFQVLKDIQIDHADTGIYIQGAGEGVAGWTMDNLLLNGCLAALHIGDRSWQNIITGLYIQSAGSNTAGSEASQVDIKGSQNYISGGLMDMYHDSTIYIHSGVSGNTINLTVQGNRLAEDFTKIAGGYRYGNDVGSHPMFWRAEDPTETRGKYWFQGDKLGIKDIRNTNIDKDINPELLLSIHGNPTYTTPPVLLLETNSGAAGRSNTLSLGSILGMASTLALNTRIAQNQVDVRPGVGPSINFYVNDENGKQGGYSDHEFGRITFRQTDGFMGTIGEQPSFQIWQKANGTWLNTVTIDPEGKMGLLGVYDPQYTLDLSEKGTLHSSSIKDDGTNVEIDKPLLINVLHFSPTERPVKASVGDMYLSSDDGNLYFYTNTGWKAVVLK